MTKFIKNITKVATCACLSFLYAGMAHAAILHFGPSDGMTSEKGYGKTGRGTISAAVVIPKSQLAKYAGARIKAIRIGLVTTNGMSNCRGWIRKGLSEKNIDSTLVASPQTGWNEVLLENGGTVSATEDLAVGYSFEQEMTVKCMSVAGPVCNGGYWIAKNGEWADKSSEGKGSLSIEIVIEGDNVPEKDLSITSSSSDRITRLGDKFNASLVVKNTANTTIDGYSYSCKIGGATAVAENVGKTLLPFCSDTINISIPSDITKKGIKIPVYVEVTASGDGYEADNATTLFMSTYDDANRTFPRNVLLEEFSTEECGNCPRAINTIEQCMKEGYDKNVIQVTHHSGYNYDFLSTPDDKELEWFYGKDGSYAPAVMLDRLSDEQCKAALGEKEDSPVMSVGYANTFSPVLKYVTGRTAFVSVKPQVEYDAATRKLDITVSMEKDEILNALSDKQFLSVYIVQDSILHHHQAGYSSDTFKHRHVYRASVTPLYGDNIAWDGNTAQAHYEYTLPESIESSLFKEEAYDSFVPVVPKDIEIVVFVSTYNADDRCDCTVFNSGKYSLKDNSSSGISITQIGSRPVSTEYYTMSGMRSDASCHGISIQRIRFADGTEKTVKVVR